MLANATFQAVTTIGYPEARIVLSQCATYLASSPKSNAAYQAINKAQSLVQKTGDLSVPMSIRNAPTKLMKDEGYGKGYKYSHDFPGNFANQEFLPNEIKGTKLYDPGKNAREEEMRKSEKQHTARCCIETSFNGTYCSHCMWKGEQKTKQGNKVRSRLVKP